MIKKLFQFIKWVYWDFRHPRPKRPFGITCYVGLPGTGKTLSMVEKLLSLRIQFPKAKIYTNFGFKYENGPIKCWEDLVRLDNGSDGIIFALDEVHTIWRNTEFSNVPQEILEMFSQNRKFAKQLICTSQTYADLVVHIKRRCHFIIECRNIANRWIFQRAFRPDEYKEKDGEYKPRRRAWRYSFIASNFIYDSYDTYAVIERIKSEIEARPAH